MKIYKHNEKIIFRGISYRYNKTYGEFRRVEQLPLKVFFSETMRQTTTGRWAMGLVEEDTPMEVLEEWYRRQVEMHARAVGAAERQLQSACEVLNLAKSKDLKL